MVTPRKIRVRLRWEDGHIDTLPEPINSNKFEVKQQDSTGGWHSFDDANEVDEEGYLIFAEPDWRDRAKGTSSTIWPPSILLSLRHSGSSECSL